MSKIVCDICGTSYDDAAGSCPVCGWNPNGEADAAVDENMDDVLNLNFGDEPEEKEKPAAAPAGKAALDLSAATGRRRPAAKPAKPADDEDEEDDEEESGSNTFLVIILVLLILALLAVSAYIGWTKFIKPRMGSDDNKPQETVEVVDSTEVPSDFTIEPETIPETTEDPGIPCQNLSFVGGMDTLTFKGQYWRLNVKAEPENTTDKIIYTSGDENVVTIDEYGRVTAVGEGETVIVVTCGSKRVETAAVVNYSTAATEATASDAPSSEAAPGTTTTVATPSNSAVLSLRKHDIILPVGTYFTLELENGLSGSDVKWSTSDSSIGAIWSDGTSEKVTAQRRGVCVITAEYNGQKDTCVVRVK